MDASNVIETKFEEALRKLMLSPKLEKYEGNKAYTSYTTYLMFMMYTSGFIDGMAHIKGEENGNHKAASIA